MFIVPPPRTSGIYKITCIPTGKFYIGSAQCIRKRWRQHRLLLDNGKHDNIHLQRAWRKHGKDAFMIEVLELVMFPEYLIEREQYYLDALLPFGGTGYNIATHADNPMRGRNVSEETRLKQSAAARQRPPKSDATRQKQRTAMLGHKRTAESIEKSASARRGRRLTKEECLMLAKKKRRHMRHIVTPPDGEEVTVNLKSFCEEHKLDYRAMQRVMQGKYKHHKGYIVRRVHQE